MLDIIKKALRITHNKLDADIEELIEVALADLRSAGITDCELNPLVRQAVRFYCRANFGLENADFEKLTIAYERLKTKLMMVGDDDV